MSIVDGNGPVIQSSIYGTHIEFNHKHLGQILRLPNEGDKCYLTGYNDLPAYRKSEREVYFVITNTGRKQKTATYLKQSC